METEYEMYPSSWLLGITAFKITVSYKLQPISWLNNILTETPPYI